jgi:HEAT repeat protein
VSLDTYLEELADPTKPLAVSKLINVSNMGPEETSTFLNVWLELAHERRQRLLRALVELAEDDVELNFDAVFMVALGDRDADLRRDAIRGLWEHEGRELIDPLLGLLRYDPDAGVRAEAALALGKFVLQAEFGTLRAADADRVEQALRRTVQDTAEVAEVTGRALESIAARSEPWVRDAIEEAFESPDRRLRLSAVHAMGDNCEPSWLPSLIPELESDDAEMRFEAANACGLIADGSAIPHLLALLHDDDDDVQEAAINALGQIGGAEAKEALEELLTDGHERVREAVIAALAEVDFADDPLKFKVRE